MCRRPDTPSSEFTCRAVRAAAMSPARCRRSSNRDRPRPCARKCTALKFKFPRGSGYPVRAHEGKARRYRARRAHRRRSVYCVPLDGIRGVDCPLFLVGLSSWHEQHPAGQWKTCPATTVYSWRLWQLPFGALAEACRWQASQDGAREAQDAGMGRGRSLTSDRASQPAPATEGAQIVDTGPKE
jgi:hypothetical protein